MGPVTDCRLLNTYFAGPGASFTPEQQQAVAGYIAYNTCVSWEPDVRQPRHRDRQL